MLDELENPNDPLSEQFQNEMFERGQQLEVLRPRVPADAEAARQFQDLVAKQIDASERLLEASRRFPVSDPDSPAAKFQHAMGRAIRKLHDDQAWSRSAIREQ